MNKKSLIMILFLFLFSAVHPKQIVKIPDAFNPTQLYVTNERMYIVDTTLLACPFVCLSYRTGLTILIYILPNTSRFKVYIFFIPSVYCLGEVYFLGMG